MSSGSVGGISKSADTSAINSPNGKVPPGAGPAPVTSTYLSPGRDSRIAATFRR